jgi:phosphopantetheinyl transferase
MNPIHRFKTPDYSGAWFEFSGDRHSLRASIQSHLREALNDAEGRLEVREDGPHWVGSHSCFLSYSHTGSGTEGRALLLFSSTCPLGVDIEKNSRAFKEHPLAIAKRYFHPHEIRKLEALRESSEEALSRAFLELWMKKEAWGKLTRKGLIHTLQLEADSAPGFRFVPVPVAPTGFSGVACVSTTRTQA